VLLSVLVSCVLLLSAQAPARNRKGTVLQAWALSVVAPVARAAASVSRGISGAADAAAEAAHATSENARLREALAQRDREIFGLRAAVAQADKDRLLAAAGAVLPRFVTSAPVMWIEKRAGL